MVKTTAYKLYILRRLRSLGTPSDELKAVYISFILLKSVYASSLSISRLKQLERVQKRACKVILGPAYIDCDNTVITLNFPRLTTTYNKELTKFGAELL